MLLGEFGYLLQFFNLLPNFDVMLNKILERIA